jgi:hypothetical protein
MYKIYISTCVRYTAIVLWAVCPTDKGKFKWICIELTIAARVLSVVFAISSSEGRNRSSPLALYSYIVIHKMERKVWVYESNFHRGSSQQWRSAEKPSLDSYTIIRMPEREGLTVSVSVVYTIEVPPSILSPFPRALHQLTMRSVKLDWTYLAEPKGLTTLSNWTIPSAPTVRGTVFPDCTACIVCSIPSSQITSSSRKPFQQ